MERHRPNHKCSPEIVAFRGEYQTEIFGMMGLLVVLQFPLSVTCCLNSLQSRLESKSKADKPSKEKIVLTMAP